MTAKNWVDWPPEIDPPQHGSAVPAINALIAMLAQCQRSITSAIAMGDAGHHSEAREVLDHLVVCLDRVPTPLNTLTQSKRAY